MIAELVKAQSSARAAGTSEAHAFARGAEEQKKEENYREDSRRHSQGSQEEHKLLESHFNEESLDEERVEELLALHYAKQ